MCGIAGVLGRTDEAAAQKMIDALAHRGPDGRRVESGEGFSVAHARLSIIDLEGGWQPLHGAGSTVIGNGEIYNYVELIAEHDLRDQLATGSDFEPLLHLYGREGPKAFERLRGMYALAFIGADGRTFLARDPFGIKPLYVLELDGAVAFASEPRAFVAAGFLPPFADQGPMREMLGLNYAIGDRSPYCGVRRLKPGEILEVKDGKLVPFAKQSYPARPLPRKTPPLVALDAVLEDAVKVHQRSDVPYGLFLSGGVDSSIIAALMARLNSRPVIAYTCGFEAPGARDERAQAERVAKALGLDWRETRFTEDDFWRLAPQAAWAMDDPTSDYAILPTLKLAEAAKASLTVVLSGEGGDELFAGYGRYRRAQRPAWLGGRPAEPQVHAPELGDWSKCVLARWRAQVQAEAHGAASRLAAAQENDIAAWLPNDLLLKLDRCLMAQGLEGRTPFLDPAVAGFARALPDHLKIRGRYGKWILRKWLERHCPAAEPWAKKKGFTVPVAAFIAPHAVKLAETLPQHEGLRHLADPDHIRAVFTDETLKDRRWPLLFTALWGNIHIAGLSPEAALSALLLS